MNGYFESQIKKKGEEIRKWAVIFVVWVVLILCFSPIIMAKLPRPADSSLPWWLTLFAPICLIPMIFIMKKAMEMEKIKKHFQKFYPEGWKEFIKRERQ